MFYRVLIAGLYHETHTFLSGTTPLSMCEVLRGHEIFSEAGGESPMAGVLMVAEEFGWDIVPSIYIRAMPGPVVEDEVVEMVWQELQAAVVGRFDGVFLVLHGAMVSESLADVEGEILSRLRRLPALEGVPLCGVLDLHANFSAAMAEHADGLIAYRENPHTDAQETAMRAARFLHRFIESGERPITVWHHPPILWPPTGTATSQEPLRTLEAMAREVERTQPEVLTVNVLPGFAFADIPDAGVNFTAVTVGSPESAQQELQHLSEYAWDHRAAGNMLDMSVDEFIQRLSTLNDGPVIVAEPSDNVGGGAPGDGTGLLRILVQQKLQRAVVVINDPESAARISRFPIGTTSRLAVGGKGSPLDAGSLSLDVTLVSTSDGRFTLEDPHSHLASMGGRIVEMGSCAVVQHEGVTILLTSRKTPPFDLGQLRSQGIVPEEQFLIVAKAAVAHRRAYDPIAKVHYSVDTPGPCSSNLKAFPYRNVHRPVYPLDG